MSHGLPNGRFPNSGTVANSTIIDSVNVVSINQSTAAYVSIFQKGERDVDNTIDVVGTGPGEFSLSRYYANGLACQDDMQVVTSANVSWSCVEYRYWAG